MLTPYILPTLPTLYKHDHTITQSPTQSLNMKVTVDFRRIFHLSLLIVGTYGGAKLLEEHLAMSAMASYGLACFSVCQISNILMNLYGLEDKKGNNGTVAVVEKHQEKGRNSKKKKRN